MLAQEHLTLCSLHTKVFSPKMGLTPARTGRVLGSYCDWVSQLETRRGSTTHSSSYLLSKTSFSNSKMSCRRMTLEMYNQIAAQMCFKRVLAKRRITAGRVVERHSRPCTIPRKNLHASRPQELLQDHPSRGWG